uniref:Amidase domain-containing protein n=1 Tax=Arundo donax TaxID=35708 RepID=A0A0A9CPJ2_ARUDO
MFSISILVCATDIKYTFSNTPFIAAYLMRFIIAGNLLGLPAITVPVGHDQQGLPIGLQLIGRPWGEASLLRVASAVEELCLKKRHRPSAFYDILKA